MTNGISAPVSPADTNRLPEPARRDVRQATKDFEALLFAQILKTAREGNGGGWLGGGDDQTGATMVEVAEEHFAKALAAGGGLGLAKMLLTRLEPGHPSPPTTDAHHPVSNSPPAA